MNGPPISDIIAAADIPSFPWTRIFVIIAVILVIGGVAAAVAAAWDHKSDIKFIAIGTLAVAGVSMFINGIEYDSVDRDGPPIAEELSETYGVTILASTESNFQEIPREPSQAAGFTVLIDGTPRPCTIVTDAVRYSISCEQGKDVIVLTPKGNS